MMTIGVVALLDDDADPVTQVVRRAQMHAAIRAYPFTPGDGSERDFGGFTFLGAHLFFKIDAYDRELEYGSPDPEDASVTVRVMTVIRWTTNDRDRDLLNGTLSKVLAINGRSITIERPDKSVLVLEGGDPMLKRLDLAYALNMHMAQGMTADRGALVMGSEERFLANQRLAHVGITRVREDLQVFTDDKDKLIRQIDRTSGNKTSALEVTGQLQVDKDMTTAALAREREKPFDPGPVIDTSGKVEREQAKRLDVLYPGLAAPEKAPERQVPQLSVPEKTKGMDI